MYIRFYCYYPHNLQFLLFVCDEHPYPRAHTQGRCLELEVSVGGARGLSPSLRGRYTTVYTRFGVPPILLQACANGSGSDSGYQQQQQQRQHGEHRSTHFELTSVNHLPLDYRVTLTQTVTPELIRYLTTSALEIDLWASCETTIGSGGGGSNGNGNGNGGGGSGSCSGSIGSEAGAAPGHVLGLPSLSMGDELEQLRADNTELRSENDLLLQRLHDLETELGHWRSGRRVLRHAQQSQSLSAAGAGAGAVSRARSNLETAKHMDGMLS